MLYIQQTCIRRDSGGFRNNLKKNEDTGENSLLYLVTCSPDPLYERDQNQLRGAAT